MDEQTRQHLHETIVRLSDGDRGAFPQVFAELWPRILGFVRQVLRDSPDAEDVAQQALINICFRAAEFDRTRDGVSWAFGVAAWEVRTHVRKRQRRRETTDRSLKDLHACGSSQEDMMIQEQLRVALADILQALPASDRASLIERDPDVRSIAATAAQRKRRQRALERIRAMWRQRHE
jgi:RNA polymerase sigma-70 factor (ECF subfamily)